MFTPPAPVFRGTGHPRVECHFLAFRGVWMRYFNSQVSGLFDFILFVWVSLAKRIHAKPRDMGNIAWSKSAFRHHAQAAGAMRFTRLPSASNSTDQIGSKNAKQFKSLGGPASRPHQKPIAASYFAPQSE